MCPNAGVCVWHLQVPSFGVEVWLVASLMQSFGAVSGTATVLAVTEPSVLTLHAERALKCCRCIPRSPWHGGVKEGCIFARATLGEHMCVADNALGVCLCALQLNGRVGLQPVEKGWCKGLWPNHSVHTARMTCQATVASPVGCEVGRASFQTHIVVGFLRRKGL